MTFTRFADVINLSSTRTADPLAAGIERFVRLEHIEPENLHIRSWGNVADGTTFTSTFKRGQVLFGKRCAYQAMQKCLAYFLDVDRTLSGHEGLIAAHNCLPGNDLKDSFAADYSYLSSLWEAISPDPMLGQYETDYRWLAQIYISIQPSTGHGGLIWHTRGAKTIELIHQNIHVEAVHDDLDEIVLDAELLDAVLHFKDPKHKAKELQIKLADRLRKHMDNPRYRKLSERLE